MGKVITTTIPTLDPDDDSDSQMWRDWKAYWKGRRANNLVMNVAALHATYPKCWSSYTEHHYGAFLQTTDERIDYWPSSNKWRVGGKGRTYGGDFRGLMGFIKNAGGLRIY